MRFPYPCIGVVFSIGGLGEGFYGGRALELFLENLDPEQVRLCYLVHGDTEATLNGRANEYCIAIYGPLLDINYIRDVFARVRSQAFAPLNHRFLEGSALDREPLVNLGHIDVSGEYVSDLN